MRNKTRQEAVLKSVKIWFDGTCLGNGTKRARAGAHVYDGRTLRSWPVPGAQTNQRAELCALLKALELCEGGETICGDSVYALKLANGQWRAKVSQDLVGPIRTLMSQKRVRLEWVPSERNLADPAKGREARNV